MGDWKKVIAWHAAQEAVERARAPKTNWLWRTLAMLCVLFVCISMAWIGYHFAIWIGIANELAIVFCYFVFCIALVAIERPQFVVPPRGGSP
jgi:TRAP-type C4-dicarboxylate transport system permease small subunit